MADIASGILTASETVRSPTSINALISGLSCELLHYRDEISNPASSRLRALAAARVASRPGGLAQDLHPPLGSLRALLQQANRGQDTAGGPIGGNSREDLEWKHL